MSEQSSDRVFIVVTVSEDGADLERDPRPRDAFLQAMNDSVLPLCRRVRLSKLDEAL